MNSDQIYLVYIIMYRNQTTKFRATFFMGFWTTRLPSTSFIGMDYISLYWKKYEGSDSVSLFHLSLDGSLSHYSSITPLSEDC